MSASPRISTKQRNAILEAAIEVCYAYRKRFGRNWRTEKPGDVAGLFGPIDSDVAQLEKTLLDTPLAFRITPDKP